MESGELMDIERFYFFHFQIEDQNDKDLTVLDETIRDEMESEMSDSYNQLPEKFRKFGQKESNPFSRESIQAF